MLPGVCLVAANIHDPLELEDLFVGADAVINLVGILHDSDSSQPYGRRFAAAHVELPRKIVAAMQRAGVRRLLHMSALKAAPDAPSAYLRSKGEGEALVRAAPGLDVTVFRPSVIFGPGDAFLNTFAGLLRALPVLPLAGASTRFAPVYVGDVADAVAAALADPATAGRTYELGGPTVYSFADLMRLMLEQTGRHRLLVPVPFGLARLKAWFLEKLPVPPLTRDQVLMLERDNVVGGAPGLAELGIRPTAAETVLPTYLDRYRKGNLFPQRNYR